MREMPRARDRGLNKDLRTLSYPGPWLSDSAVMVADFQEFNKKKGPMQSSRGYIQRSLTAFLDL